MHASKVLTHLASSCTIGSEVKLNEDHTERIHHAKSVGREITDIQKGRYVPVQKEDEESSTGRNEQGAVRERTQEGRYKKRYREEDRQQCIDRTAVEIDLKKPLEVSEL